MKSRWLGTLLLLLVAATAACGSTLAQVTGNFEAPPTLAGVALAPPVLLSGPLHTVAEPVAIEHFDGRFEIDSKLGKFRVAGVDMLGVRVRELAAIEALEQVNRSEAFQQALLRSAQVPVQFVGNAFTDPVGTAGSVATGVGTVFGRIGRLATTSAHAVADSAGDLTSSTRAPEGRPAPEGEPVPPAFTGDPFGFNRARREWAKLLNIDPYTTNPVLRPRLDDAARATFAGNFAINATLGIVVAPLQYAASFDSVVRDSVWNLPVIDLVAQNERRLRTMNIEGRPVRDLFRNRWFTPTLQTALVHALEQLPKARGRYSVVAAASTINGETRARAFIGAVRMLGYHHAHVEHVHAIRMAGVAAVGTTAGGELVVAADVDHVWWNEEAAEFAARPDVASKRRTLLVSGTASARAVAELGRAKWNVRTGLRPGATD